MNAQRTDAIELQDFGDAMVETRQFYPSMEFPDYYFGRGFYPGWSEGPGDGAIDLSPL